MSYIGRLWTRLKNAVEGEATTIEATFTALEQKLLPGFSALVHKVENTIGDQGLTILQQGVADIVTVVASGGNIASAVAALIPQVTAQVKADMKQDAATAAHGALELMLAHATTPAEVPAETSPQASPPAAA